MTVAQTSSQMAHVSEQESTPFVIHMLLQSRAIKKLAKFLELSLLSDLYLHQIFLIAISMLLKI
jgi:hypothetical protein